MDGEDVSCPAEKAKGIVNLERNGVKGGGRKQSGEDGDAKGFTFNVEVQREASTNSSVHSLD